LGVAAGRSWAPKTRVATVASATRQMLAERNQLQCGSGGDIELVFMHVRGAESNLDRQPVKPTAGMAAQ
jgi:hypothetical protein